MNLIEQKDKTFDNDFGYSFPTFLLPPKKRENKKRRMNNKKSCLSA